MSQSARPLSPHLQVYRPQITSVLSILHRMSGMVLALGSLFLTWWLAAAAVGGAYFAFTQAVYASWFGTLVLLGFSVALFYHLCNGIRHMFWDIGRGFDLDSVTRTGWTMLVATAALTVGAWAIGLSVGG